MMVIVCLRNPFPSQITIARDALKNMSSEPLPFMKFSFD
jgi:hypothetical protein